MKSYTYSERCRRDPTYRDRERARKRAAYAVRRRIALVEPLPHTRPEIDGALLTPIVPPWPSAILRLMDSPSPVPFPSSFVV